MAGKAIFKISGLEHLEGQIRSGLSKNGSPSNPVRRAFRQWAFQYLVFTRRRFNTFSRGGGDWRPLAPSTIKERRKGRGTGMPAILRNTGVLFNALELNATGNIVRYVQNGVQVGIGGPAVHPGGRLTIGQIAALHNDGGQKFLHPPQRKILADPDASTTAAMVTTMKDAVLRMTKG